MQSSSLHGADCGCRRLGIEVGGIVALSLTMGNIKPLKMFSNPSPSPSIYFYRNKNWQDKLNAWIGRKMSWLTGCYCKCWYSTPPPLLTCRKKLRLYKLVSKMPLKVECDGLWWVVSVSQNIGVPPPPPPHIYSRDRIIYQGFISNYRGR
jgi:hypothetical protein